MKILLRDHRGVHYAWWTAKYNGKDFIVNDRLISESNIVSIINDNRKNYIRCSSCGKIFPKNGKKFAKHKEESIGITPCLTCHKLRANEVGNTVKKYIANGDGTYTQKFETRVELACRISMWTEFDCNSRDAIKNCVNRQCGNAKGNEITDIFIELPGVFDDIITVDKVIDHGYDYLVYFDNSGAEYLIDDDCGLRASINSMGIVDKFVVDSYDYYGFVYYSKKYDLFFTRDESDKYNTWPIRDINVDIDKVKEHIRNIYK